jgi:hypothetical protein
VIEGKRLSFVSSLSTVSIGHQTDYTNPHKPHQGAQTCTKLEKKGEVHMTHVHSFICYCLA